MTNYKQQVALLLNILPEVAKETCFALHGGTAINLFIRNLPRLSVDIDLTYIPIESREDTFKNVNLALERLKGNIESHFSQIKIQHQKRVLKLQISNYEAQVKLEVNQGMRGVLNPVEKKVLCEKAQEEFDVFCALNLVPFGQLYGGKICAALDRQHPRDLFDIQYLLKNEGFIKEVKIGFLLALLSSNRPIQEILFPHYKDQSEVLIHQFKGMATEDFGYKDFENTRNQLIKTIHNHLSDKDWEFLLGFEAVTPDWTLYDFEHFPAVQWKLHNLRKLKNQQPAKYQKGIDFLRKNYRN